MKWTVHKIIVVVSILLCSCSQPSEYFIGKWQILHIVENNVSIDLMENWMHLKSDGTFESYDGASKKTEQGIWEYQSKEKIISIDGQGEDGKSHWSLSMKNDTLIFESTRDNLYLISKKLYH